MYPTIRVFSRVIDWNFRAMDMLQASLVAIFSWWFATGIMLMSVRYADRAGGDAHILTLVTAFPVAVLGGVAVVESLSNVHQSGAYFGFIGALCIWGWIELAFLTGIITGPRRDQCPEHLCVMGRWKHAWGVLAYHEISLLLGFIGLLVVSWSAPNITAVMTYGILFFARIAAKLNLFFGVPRINLQFLPDKLSHLHSLLRKGPLTIVFPVSLGFLIISLIFIHSLVSIVEHPGVHVAHGLLITLIGLALLEHILMVVPLPDAKLWNWMLPDNRQGTWNPHWKKRLDLEEKGTWDEL